MLKELFSKSSPAAKLLITGYIIVVCFLITLLLGGVSAFLFFDINPFLRPGTIYESSIMNDVGVMKFFQSLYSVGIFAAPPFLLAYLFHARPYEYLCLNRGASPLKYLLTGLLMLSVLPLINLAAEFNARLVLPGALSEMEAWMRSYEEKARVITELFLEMDSAGSLSVNILIMALIPAVGEELLFRGLVQKLLIQWTRNSHLGVILAAILFSTLHLQFFGFIPRMALGVIFGYLLVWTQSIWVPVTAHFINNSLAVIGFYFINRGDIPENVESIGSSQNVFLSSIISLFLTGWLIFLFYRSRER